MFEDNKLKILDTIHESFYKVPKASVSLGEYLGSEVIVKQGGKGLAREANILREIDGPHIPKVIEHYERSKDDHVLVLNKLSGMPLDALIQLQPDWSSSPIDSRRAIKIVQGLASCFTTLKNAGFLYRDLNLGHILVDGDEVGLVDHEWDVRLTNLDRATVDSLAGTWETMAPEEYEIGDDMTESSGVFTLGTVLLQLVSGRSPFYISSEDEPDAKLRRTATLKLMEAFDGIKTGDEQLDSVINKSLQFDPSNRFQSIEEFTTA